LWINNDDDPAFLRAITSPKRGIGHQTLGQLGSFATQYKLSLFESLFAGSLPSAVNARAITGLHEFALSATAGGNPFNPPAGILKGNVKNTTVEANFPLGYFRLSEWDEKVHVVQ
jgi:hypothetical protein